MSFTEKIAALTQRIPNVFEHLETEEATKNALVMPFIAALGYDVFNPREVVPEFTADVGIKKGEKVDYAIKRDNEVIMLFECKTAGASLSKANVNQLFRYFTVTNARIAILTNGVQYRFYSDLEEPNRMDSRPFLELDLAEPREDLIAEVRKLSKENFDLERMLSTANELKYLREVNRVLGEQFEDPDPELVRFFYKQAYPKGMFTAAIREQFTGIVKKALQNYIRERVSNRLRTALEREDAAPERVETDVQETSVEEIVADDGIETTEEEIEGFHIVKAIVRQVVLPERIVHRDTKSYMGILLDNNNRKPICRLRFNYSQKYIGLFDEAKNETKHPLETLDEIYQYAEQLKQTTLRYEG